MSDVIGRGVIEVSADSSKLNAAISEARERLRGLGEAGQQSSNRSAASIDRYVRKLQEQNATLGKSKREIELYRLAMRGATDEQLRAANSALALREAWERQQNAIRDAARRQQQAMDDAAARTDRWHDRVTTALRSVATVAGAAALAGAYAFDRIATMAGDFQDLAEKTGDTAENLASLYVAAKVGGLEMETVAAAIVKLNKNLSGLDEDSGEAARALAAIGLSVKDLAGKGGAEQLTIIAQALNGFEESAKKSEVAMVLMGKTGANLLPFMKELGAEGGRQKILTQEQIELADEYADRNARVSAELGLHAAAIATKLLPEVNKLMGDLSELAKDEEVVAAVTATMKGAFFAAITTFQAFALVGSDVAFTVRTIAREMDGLKRQAAALQKLDFAGVRAIGKEVADAAAADRARLDAFQRGIMKLTPGQAAPAAPPAPPAAAAPGTTPPAKPKPQVNYTPKPKGGKDKAAKSDAAQEAKAEAQLQKDIAKAATDAVLNTYQNADRILSARRSAGLVDEREYYEAKAALIRLDADTQARALEADIARLSQEKATGKDRIENERQLVEARAKLAKLRENEAVALELNAGEQVAKVNAIKQAYVEAAAAAASYIETVQRQNARIVEGVGRGAKFRERQTGINQIEDKLTGRKTELDSDLRRKDITAEQYAVYLKIAQDTYRQEVEAFDARTKAIDALQADGFNGLTEALANYADEARNVAAMTEDAMGNALSGIEDAFVQLATTGKASFSDLLRSIQADIARIGFRSLIGSAIDSIGGSAGTTLQALFGKASPAQGAANALGSATSAANAVGDVAGQAAQSTALAASTAALTANTASIAAATTGATALTTAATSAAAALANIAATSAAGAGGDALASVVGNGAADAAGAAVGAVSGAADAATQAAQATAQAAYTAAVTASTAAVSAHAASVTADSAAIATAAASAAALTTAETTAAAAIAAASASSVAALAGVTAAASAAAAALAAAAASSGASTGGNILATVATAAAGGRAIGGPVSAGGMYRVNERGPELLTVAGKEYLMMGAHGGEVTPAAAGPSRGGDTYVNVSVSPPPGASRATAMQFGATAARQMEIALRRNG